MATVQNLEFEINERLKAEVAELRKVHAEFFERAAKDKIQQAETIKRLTEALESENLFKELCKYVDNSKYYGKGYEFNFQMWSGFWTIYINKDDVELSSVSGGTAEDALKLAIEYLHKIKAKPIASVGQSNTLPTTPKQRVRNIQRVLKDNLQNGQPDELSKAQERGTKETE